MKKATRTILVVLAFSAPAVLPRPALAQLRFCAGRPCPDGDKGGPGSAAGKGGANAAGPAPRAVLIDAVVLTPALEKANARLGIEQAVMSAVSQEGWEPVSVTTDCKDLGCAGAAAAAANASYAVVLTGRFVKQETYVADLGVSIWRAGSVIASRNETEEEAAAHRDGAPFFLCGPPSGACTTKLLTTKLQQYAAGLVADENVAIRVRKKVAAATPAPETAPAPTTVAVGPTTGADSAGPSRTLGWALVIGGGVLVGAGIALWAANDMGVDCHNVVGDVDSCRGQLRTRPAAIGTGIAGLAAVGAGVAIFWLGKDESRMAVSLKGNGLSVGGRF